MDTDHNSRPPPLPAKLRWRPYANGNSLKAKKPKKVAIQDMNAKAVAHKMRGKQYYTGKASQLPTGVRLQWEEAETIESMSTGGHPHNHHYHHSSSESDSDTSSPNTPRRTSTTSTSSSNSNSSPTSSKPYSNAIQRAISSLPSPPSSQPLAPTSGMDLVGGQADFGLFNASLPGLTGTDFMKHGLPLATLASNTAYQLALDALFQPQRNLFQATPNNTNNNKFGAANTASMPTNTSQATNIFGSVPLSVVSKDPNPVLSNDDLLNMASIDELLSSCGYAEPMDTSMMMSPTITDQSLNSSPMSSLVDFSNNSRGTSPAATSFSPMAIGQSIEAFLAQPIYPITQQVSQSSQQGLFSTTTTTPVSVSAPSNPYVILAEDFSAPFSYITAGGVDSTGAPTAWPSLFPEPTSAPQRTEIATQTDGPYSPATSPAPKPITAAAIQSTLGLTDEELDPDWLNFLDEASPLFTDAELPPSPPHSGDEDMTPPRTEQSSNQRATPKNWADQLLKPDISTPPSGHRGFPSSGALGGVGQLGSGGLIRTLQGTNQQKYNKPSSTKSPSEGATSSEKSANAPTATISPSSSSNTEDASHQDDSSSAFGDLMAMIRNLWTKKE